MVTLFRPVAAAPIRPYKSPLQFVPKDCQRIWDETRPNLGRDTTESGARHDRIWEEARLNAGRRSLTGIDRGLPCLQTNGLCKIRQAPTSFSNSKYAQILYSLPYIAIRPARDAYSFFVD